MKKVLRFAVVAAALMAAIGASAQRDIVLKLNKHNFIGGDTLNVTAEFKGFESDPIVSDVYADIVDSNDSIVASAVMHRLPDGTFSTSFDFPKPLITKHSDITKISRYFSIEGNNIYGSGLPIVLIVDNELIDPLYEKQPINEKRKKLGVDNPSLPEWTTGEAYMTNNSYTHFLEIPLNTISYICPGTSTLRSDVSNPPIGHRWLLYVDTVKTSNLPNRFMTLYVSGTTSSGETVASLGTISLNQMEVRQYLEDNTSETN